MTIPDWKQFIIEHGFKAHEYDLAAVLGKSVLDVVRVRRTGACKKLKKWKGFTELFTLWHGRAPEDADWPPPQKMKNREAYEWQEREIALLASLVGRMGVKDIAEAMTNWLRIKTSDANATRTEDSVKNIMNRIGLQTKDVVGGITTTVAGREINSSSIVHQAIRKNQLKAVRQGKLWVISRESWEAWKEKRVFPPKGYVLLTSIKQQMSIKSDKLSEMARLGYIPTAIRCNPFGAKGPSTQFGTWYIDREVAKKMVADRRAGRPMPWHGKILIENTRVTFNLWQQRKHPESCETCAGIWGKKGAPITFEEYAERYPPLVHGQKRHLTRKWDPGFTLSELAVFADREITQVQEAIDMGVLMTNMHENVLYVSRTDATRWKARRFPTGNNYKSWITLDVASKQYLFTIRELRGFISAGELKSKTETGETGEIVYVSRHQCGQLREKIGFTEEQAAKKVGITLPRFRILLDGVDWRRAELIPLVTVQAVIKRLQSHEGYSIEEAAEKLGKTTQWIHERIHDGTIKVCKAKWDRRRVYISEPMFKRLQQAILNPVKQEKFGADWLRLSEAANEAMVCTTTVIRWATSGDIERKKSKIGWRYHREAIRAKAREYWKTVRFHRAEKPKWLLTELAEPRDVPASRHEIATRIPEKEAEFGKRLRSASHMPTNQNRKEAA